ncbi:Phosphotyrosyl phosphatase activator [Gloeophyllum trabeum ATCC 11539]|uniref:Serine/threonine-protein phosphatase 2A activator n=1 Tax=Gloeophyllum trabeum (strain ATCC 11539 / FP-39264 / Madison 617) TaxID=670483 RepID=S7Q366_GLOTA|nr:Phosphotyrosyl phosphatase activator [Gloeophyllum trabeum ATCC 11539]EPQ53928.1 Phosphotyrosyl phosphatase activator [Gloeophyllum trabeum ATCC 11539]
MAASQLSELREITISDIKQISSPPTLKIRTDHDVEVWKMTRGYRDYGIFLRRLSDSVVGTFLPWEPESVSQAITSLTALLDKLDSLIDEIPPLLTPQRFGNLAFRTWGKRLEEEADSLLSSLLPSHLSIAVPLIKPYFLTSFGHFVRMDYGTGHETSFGLFLLCLTLVRFLHPNPDEERQIVLILFVRYLRLCWRLQDVYKLEPAGSHGVWGLDDYSFLGYIFGSAQLRDQSEIPVSAILRRPLPPTNLYFMQITRIHQVKHGPFHEHSSQLHAIAVGVPNWGKVNSGLFKMYEAEVLGKRVVVQHIPLGGLLEWDITNGTACSVCTDVFDLVPEMQCKTPVLYFLLNALFTHHHLGV